MQQKIKTIRVSELCKISIRMQGFLCWDNLAKQSTVRVSRTLCVFKKDEYEKYQKWKASKFVNKNGKLILPEKKRSWYCFRLSANLIAQFYDSSSSKYAKGNLLDLGCGKYLFMELRKIK